MLSRFQLTDICQSILCNYKLCDEVAFTSVKVIQFLVIVSTNVHLDSHNRESCLETVKKKLACGNPESALTRCQAIDANLFKQDYMWRPENYRFIN